MDIKPMNYLKSSNIAKVLIVALLGLMVTFAGCVGSDDSTDKSDEKVVKLGLPPWPGATVKSEVVKEILESKGYTVELMKLDAGIVYAQMADGELDGTVAAWMPVTHAEYWKQYGDKLDKANANLDVACVGLAVPTYVYDSGIKSVADLKGNGEKFDGTIVGIEPGAGVVINTEKALKEYELIDFKLKTSSTPAMIAELDKAIKNEKFVVVTLWEPQSAFVKFNITMLEDPKKVYGGTEQVYTIVRQDFKDDNPEVYSFFQKFNISSATQSEWVYKYSDLNEDPSEIAKEWIKNNPEAVAEWTKDMN
ncbi:glycine betaine/proline transport system substrate-binding protein [Methanococcus voltae]|uniref:Glycine betaine/proline transport system substrate-binding protein n=1 Tax=Methanococcus voltae TaxID=2188 RepID=A0A8J7RMH4_METVO|nr:glycine betaine ABC transporter substrate-binding protein [Methanococcus voltae]MBP2201591.1 glycine betaine/proline transport system substrate-binding protein [Methanococcus voltae]